MKPKKRKRYSEQKMERMIKNLFDRILCEKGGHTRSFEEAALLTADRGVVIHLSNGQTFDLTIQDSSHRYR